VQAARAAASEAVVEQAFDAWSSEVPRQGAAEFEAARGAVPMVDLRVQFEAAAGEDSLRAAEASGLEVSPAYAEEEQRPVENLQQAPREVAEPEAMEPVLVEAPAEEAAPVWPAEEVPLVGSSAAEAPVEQAAPVWPMEQAAQEVSAAEVPVEQAAGSVPEEAAAVELPESETAVEQAMPAPEGTSSRRASEMPAAEVMPPVAEQSAVSKEAAPVAEQSAVSKEAALPALAAADESPAAL
jgi:hypothetical protein